MPNSQRTLNYPLRALRSFILLNCPIEFLALKIKDCVNDNFKMYQILFLILQEIAIHHQSTICLVH